jgi:predicted transcriptional regulator
MARKTNQISLRLTDETLERLEKLAEERGCSRGQAVADLIEGPHPEMALPTRERALWLLSESAESGSVTARVALARLLMAEARPEEPAAEDPFDAAADRRLKVIRGGN